MRRAQISLTRMSDTGARPFRHLEHSSHDLEAREGVVEGVRRRRPNQEPPASDEASGDPALRDAGDLEGPLDPIMFGDRQVLAGLEDVAVEAKDRFVVCVVAWHV